MSETSIHFGKRGDKKALEEDPVFSPKFDQDGLIPAVAMAGHTQKVVSMHTDCDQDALIIYGEQHGAGACHTGRNSCFYRTVALRPDANPVELEFTGGDKTFDPSEVYKKQ